MAFDWKHSYAEKITTAEQSVRAVRHGQRVFIGSGAGEPQLLVEALSSRADLSDTEIIHVLTLGVATYVEPRFGDRFRHNAYFIGPNVRGAVAAGRADYTPIFLSEIAALFRSGRVVIDVALISVGPPDEHGYCSFGVSTDIVKPAAETAKLVIAEVNENMPRALGDCFIHVRDIDQLVPSGRKILESSHGEPDELARGIACHIAGLVEDGSTLQIGIGTIPDAVLPYLSNFRNLGVHTEMFSDGIIPLVERGVITNAEKSIHRGKIVASFVIGTRHLYDFIDNNPLIEFRPTEYVNDPFIISQNDKMVSINSAIEVDVTGQVCADSLGTLFYSGIGGQVDFVRGAARSKGGKPIIALPSTAEDETISRIVPHLKPGAGVVTSRGDVHYVVTEYGVAFLHGKTIRERALALIEIAHPKFRPWLLAECKSRNLVYRDQIEMPFRTPSYPAHLERWVEIREGARVYLRPLKLTDEPRVRDLFYKLSPESVRSRFFQLLKALPHEQLQNLLRVDYEKDMALVALNDATETSTALAIAHYRNDPQTNFAEAAFLVLDEWQGKGIGSALLDSLVEMARQQGIAGFSAEVLSGNHGMMRVFHKCGYPVESRLEEGVYHLRIPFTRRGRARLPAPASSGKPSAPPT
jgi:acyl-CoA hydrolase/GNAT superfamily N-acetyltransferase